MKMAKILIAAAVVTVFNAIVGMVCCGGIFRWVYELEPTDIWKSMDGPPGATFFAGAFVLNVLLAGIYAMLHKGLPGRNVLLKGIIFGLCVWAVGTLPGMFATYTFMTVATGVVIYWTILDLVTNPLKGAIIALIYGE